MLDHLPPFRRRSVALALYRMLTGPRFDICVVRNALTVADLHPERAALGGAYARPAVRLPHTTSFAEMPPGFRAALAAQTPALFSGRPAPVTADLRDLAGLAGVAWAGPHPSAFPPALA